MAEFSGSHCSGSTQEPLALVFSSSDADNTSDGSDSASAIEEHSESSKSSSDDERSSRKRKRKVKHWVHSKRKAFRNLGKEYLSAAKKKVNVEN